MLVVAPILQTPNWTLPFHIFVDVFDVAVGAVLMQEATKGWFRPIYYASKLMSHPKRNYLVTDVKLSG